MAEEVLVGAETLIESIQGVVREHAEQQRIFTLLMLIPTEPVATDTKYTLVVSAPWLDTISPRKAVQTILDNLINQLGSAESPEFQQVARVTVIKTKDSFVQRITSAFEVTNGSVTFQHCDINGVFIERAILLESHRSSASVTVRNSTSHTKVGRNAPCPCGSGKKDKHCCGA